MSYSRTNPADRKSGFTLVELIAVMGIMVILMTLMVPAVQSLTGSVGRQGAINRLLGTFDQARVAALESGANVYVAFADSSVPDESMRYRSFIVFRERSESDTPPVGTASVSPYVFLTGWKNLPRGIAFKSEKNSLVGQSGSSLTISPTDLFPRVANATLPVLMFNSTGAILQPIDSTKLRIYVYEGFYESGRDVLTGNSGGLFDVIAFSRFTGRALLQVSTL